MPMPASLRIPCSVATAIGTQDLYLREYRFRNSRVEDQLHLSVFHLWEPVEVNHCLAILSASKFCLLGCRWDRMGIYFSGILENFPGTRLSSEIRTLKMLQLNALLLPLYHMPSTLPASNALGSYVTGTHNTTLKNIFKKFQPCL